ncbi:MAG: hypothetical protein KF833_18050 [Verrucomicrobiae bacterium]|nr:hypothetical protein [Verrucomicrobiae bacterium]
MTSFDHARLRVFPLSERRSMTRVEEILIDPDGPVAPLAEPLAAQIRQAADAVRAARARGATVMLIYGAHLLRNGAALLLDRFMERGWITHLATNGAGTIHDWEYAWHGRSTESVEDNVATGTFGTWDETGRNIHLALLAGGLRGDGYGAALGRYINEDGCTFPAPDELAGLLAQFPADPLAPAAADLLVAMRQHGIVDGPHPIVHRWKHASIVAAAFRRGVPLTVHPGIGYDIVACHPMFNGAVLGRAAEIDFKRFAASVEGLDGGVVLNVGSAIMGPQVFEKSLSCVHNLRRQDGRPNVSGHTIYVVDLQEGGGWDWTRGEPPKTHPGYYLRFCKSYSRMGGAMHYLTCDNAAFVHTLAHELGATGA